MKKRILFIDDDRSILSSLRRMLRSERHEWDMVFIDCPHAALDQLFQSGFDTVVTDFQMPGLNGLQFLQCLRQNDATRDIPVIILTGVADRCIKRKALDLGATDLLNKPIEVEDLLARVRNALRLKESEDDLKRQNTLLEQKVHARTKQLEASHLDIIWRLGKAAEYRDEQTGNHVIRVGCFSRVIAQTMGLDRPFVDRLFLAAPLHDIGKIGIPDSVLLKPSALTEQEWCIMRRHCEMGAELLQQESSLAESLASGRCQESELVSEGICNPVLELAATVALTHHEQWNGEGYPSGLARDQIPLAGRIVAISDVFDALTSERPYKSAISEDEAFAIIQGNVGRHFDPEVHEAFVLAFEEIATIGDRFSDKPGGAMRQPHWAELVTLTR